MKFLLALFLLFVAATSRASLPTEAPEAAIFVTSCHQIVHVIVVMPGGKTLVFDGHSTESADDVKALAARSHQPARVYELGCYREEPIRI